MNIFEWLSSLYQNEKIEIHLVYNDVDYDSNFFYNPQTDILTADSSSCPEFSFGGEGTTITEHVLHENIDITIKFK